MNELILYHGSSKIIHKPEFGKGNPRNDYGLGFYCTEEIELAKEWACSSSAGGYANAYYIVATDLIVLDLDAPEYGVLDWLALLVNNRTFTIDAPIVAQSKEYLTEHFLPDISKADAIRGYRADDSYFTFAMDFLSNTISIRQLSRAMQLGLLREQFVLKSERAFNILRFSHIEPVDGEVYYAKRLIRDTDAREQYLGGERYSPQQSNDIYMIDILREEMKRGDERIQRNLFE